MSTNADRKRVAVIGAPNSPHARTVLDALAAGLHVLIEMPLFITLEDAEAIVAARDWAGTAVQVAYNNRFDLAYEKLVSELPSSTDSLRYINVLMDDPEFGPYLGPEAIARGADVPAEPDRAGARRRGRAGARTAPASRAPGTLQPT